MVSEVFRLEGFGKILESWGLMDALLPFLLIFTLVFAVLEKSKILSSPCSVIPSCGDAGAVKRDGLRYLPSKGVMSLWL